MCKLGLKVYLIDVDNKASKMENIQQWVQKGLLEIYPIQSKLVEDSLRSRTLKPGSKPVSQPQGYLELVDLITKWEKEPPEGSLENGVVVLDSMSKVEEHMVRLISYLGVAEGYDKWRIVKGNYAFYAGHCCQAAGLRSGKVILTGRHLTFFMEKGCFYKK